MVDAIFKNSQSETLTDVSIIALAGRTLEDPTEMLFCTFSNNIQNHVKDSEVF